MRNTATLTRTHLISAVLHTLFLLLRVLLLSRSLRLYGFLCSPAFILEFYLDRLGRPSHTPDGSLKSAGEDLDAKGLTEYMWDVVYWTWINLVLVLLLGDGAWWLFLVIPSYSTYLAVTTVGGMKRLFEGIPEARENGAGSAGSKRQHKLEKRGGQKEAYR